MWLVLGLLVCLVVIALFDYVAIRGVISTWKESTLASWTARVGTTIVGTMTIILLVRLIQAIFQGK
jgi:hypothetical protein